jgi:hypothetical protein
MTPRTRLLIPTVVALLLVSLPAQAFGAVKIKRINYNPYGADGTRNLNREWVQIHNGGTRGVVIWRWRIRDAAGHVFIFPNIRLTPGQDVRVHTGGGFDAFGDPIHLYWGSSSHLWNNDGDTATLRRANGTLASRCRYTGGPPGYKVCS